MSATPNAQPPVHYLLDLREPASHLVHVTMTVAEASPATEIQFPAWNNLYQIRDFVRNVQEVEARCNSVPEQLERLDPNTWRSGLAACSPLEVRYAVFADEESVFSSYLTSEHAFLNFALLLFYLPRARSRPVRVKFLLPSGWKLATTLETDGEEYTAPDYDRLADSPAEAGYFQEYEYEQGIATYRVVVTSAPGDYSAERLLTSLKKITAAETALMGEVPFLRYTFFLHFMGEGGGGMEHRDGTAISIPPGDLRRDWQGFEATVAHEFFHLWNVKRIRPQNLEPIDYQRGNDTRDLWFSEGVTSTYQELVLLRAGLMGRRAFYEHLAEEVRRLQERPARRFQSVEEAGREAWLEKYPDYFRPQRSISYYNKGALLGFLLDFAIRHASGNKHSLDHLMRRLNEDFAHRGRFFTQADLRRIIRDLAPGWTTLDEFFDEYLSGTQELDYNTYLAFAGLKLVSESRERPSLDFDVAQGFDGSVTVNFVAPGSEAERAGAREGDVLLSLNGRALHHPPDEEFRKVRPGSLVKLEVRRGKRTLEVEYRTGRKTETEYRVEEIKHATPVQIRVRRGCLEGVTD